VARPGARRHDHVLRLDRLVADRDPVAGAAGDELPETLQPGDLVLLEEELDPLGHLGDDGLLAPLHLREIELHARDRDAVVLEVVSDLLVFLGGGQQRLGRDAAHVEAGAAEGELALRVLPAFDAGGLESQLRRADRGDVAARPAADHHYVEGVHYRISLDFQNQPGRIFEGFFDGN
jgi:hypothetical protein